MESSALDYVAQTCLDLSDALSVDNSDRDTILANHIKKVSNIVAPVEDFKKSEYIITYSFVQKKSAISAFYLKDLECLLNSSFCMRQAFRWYLQFNLPIIFYHSLTL